VLEGVDKFSNLIGSVYYPDAAWYTKMETCITPLPEVNDINTVAGGALEKWPKRVTAESYNADTQLWKVHVMACKRIDKFIGEEGNAMIRKSLR